MDETPLENKELKAAPVEDVAPAADAVEEPAEAPAEAEEAPAPAPASEVAAEVPVEGPESAPEAAEVVGDCGHSGPLYAAASGTDVVYHCAACSGRSS